MRRQRVDERQRALQVRLRQAMVLPRVAVTRMNCYTKLAASPPLKNSSTSLVPSTGNDGSALRTARVSPARTQVGPRRARKVSAIGFWMSAAAAGVPLRRVIGTGVRQARRHGTWRSPGPAGAVPAAAHERRLRAPLVRPIRESFYERWPAEDDLAEISPARVVLPQWGGDHELGPLVS